MVRSAVLALLLAAPVGAADPKPLPPGLDLVPPDAALFAYVDVEAVWKGKIGDTLRQAVAAKPPAPIASAGPLGQRAMPTKDMPKEMAKGMPAKDAAKTPDGGTAPFQETLDQIREATGLTPDMVKSVLVYNPKLKGPGDEKKFVFVVTFHKPYDAKKVIAGLGTLNPGDYRKEKVKEEKPGVYLFDDLGVRADMTDPTRIVVANKENAAGPAKQAAVDGPTAPAVRAAAAGKHFVLALNFANLPDEIRQENLPQEVQPYRPLLLADTALFAAEVKGGEVVGEARVKTPTKAKAIEAEKSLGAFQGLLVGLLGRDLDREEKQAKSDGEKQLIALVKELIAALKDADIKTAGNDAVATVKVRSDLPFGQAILAAGLAGGGRMGMAAERSQVQNNLKQLGLAMHNYHDTHGSLPPAATLGRKGKPLLSWRVAVLPYIEQNDLYQKFKLDEPWDSPHNKKVLDDNPMPPVFRVPGANQPGDKATHFRVFVGNGALFDPVQVVKFAEITDGLSNTLMVVQGKDAVPWTKPDDIAFDPKKNPAEQLLFIGGVTHVLMGDGSVRALRQTVATDTLRALVTRNGGEVVSE